MSAVPPAAGSPRPPRPRRRTGRIAPEALTQPTAGMPRGLAGQVAWVAGGGRGIGRAICDRLAAEGALVVVGSRTADEFKEAADAIREAGGQARGIALDVARRESVQAFAAAAEAAYGAPRILVFCAGINVRQPAEDYPEEAWLRVLNINLNGAYRFCQEGGRRMIKAGNGGSIVTITSLLAHMATPNQGAYAASKGGLLQYTRLLAVEWAKHRIRVNSVSPGYVATAMNAAARRQPSYSVNALAATPMKRFGTCDEIAQAVRFLAGPEASFITGTDLPVDGGFLSSRPAIVARTA